VELLKTVVELNVNLIELNMSKNKFSGSENIWGEIISQNQLTSLNLSSCDMGKKADTEPLVKAITSCTSLRHLNISHNGLSQNACKMVGEMLITNTSLTHVDVNYMRSVYYRLIELTDLIKLIESNCTLTYLNARGSKSYDITEFEQVMEAVGKNTTLLYLNISYFRTNLKWERISDLLSINHYITELPKTGLRTGKIDTMKKLEERNREYWHKRFHWCCKVLVLTRIFYLSSNGMDVLPSEMICHLLYFFPPRDLLRQQWMRRVMDYASDLQTLFWKKEKFAQFVFGNQAILIEYLLD